MKRHTLIVTIVTFATLSTAAAQNFSVIITGIDAVHGNLATDLLSTDTTTYELRWFPLTGVRYDVETSTDLTTWAPIQSEQSFDLAPIFTPTTTSDFIISSDMAVGGDLPVAYTLTGSATLDSNFVALAGTATIPSSQSMVAIPVTAITDSMIEGDECITLNISPSDNYGIDTAVASITVKDLPFDAFRHANFGGSTTKIAAAEDFDSDGILHLVEYALGLDPTTSSTLPGSSAFASHGLALDIQPDSAVETTKSSKGST